MNVFKYGKLSENEVMALRLLYRSQKYSYKKLASIFEVTESAICEIVKRKHYNNKATITKAYELASQDI
jgi:predicted DNA-binding protein YlxM (UPF0122 family)